MKRRGGAEDWGKRSTRENGGGRRGGILAREEGGKSWRSAEKEKGRRGKESYLQGHCSVKGGENWNKRRAFRSKLGEKID